MIVSKKWLQTYFESELPATEELVEALLLHSFEIEGVEEREGDTFIDIDVLPNRAHDSLSHRGIAGELATLFNLPLREDRYSSPSLKEKSGVFSLRDESNGVCKRYIARVVEGVEVRKSPEWLRSRLEGIGQRSINALVDATNYVLFDLGQPLHVFDADKVVGGITVRFARDGEAFEMLGGETLELTSEDLVIADDEGVLALAGMKGGTKAELTEETSRIIIESANFDPVRVRKTARRHRIATDASKRYENGITSELAFTASNAMLSLVEELASTPETKVLTNEHGFSLFEFYSEPEEQVIVPLTMKKTRDVLGFPISEDDVRDIFRRLRFSFVSREGGFDVVIPFERLDLRIEEDLIEEIGRIYGYHNIPTTSLDAIHFSPRVNSEFFLSQSLRNFFIERGFSEVMNYSFLKKGEVRVLNPVASNRSYLRATLEGQLEENREKNKSYADILNTQRIRVFEIGVAHHREGEDEVLTFIIGNLGKGAKKRFGTEDAQRDEILNELRVLCGEGVRIESFPGGATIHLSSCKKEISENESELLALKSYGEGDTFQGISIYPHIRRDVSFWVGDSERDPHFFGEAFRSLQLDSLRGVYLIDSFEKEGKKSYAFSLIFQSFEKTLSDEEVNREMEKVYEFLTSQGCEVR